MALLNIFCMNCPFLVSGHVAMKKHMQATESCMNGSQRARAIGIGSYAKKNVSSD